MGISYSRAAEVARATLIALSIALSAVLIPSIAAAGTCLTPEGNTNLSFCLSETTLDCPGPGCPSGALLLRGVSFATNGRMTVSGLPDAGFCEDASLALDRVGKLAIVGRAGSIADVEVAYRRSLDLAEEFRGWVAKTCAIDPNRILAAGIGRDEPLKDMDLRSSVGVFADPALIERIEILRGMMF